LSYYFAKTIDAPFEAAVARKALAEEGFGVITEIDVAKTLKTKIGVDFRPYLILGALAQEPALSLLPVPRQPDRQLAGLQPATAASWLRLLL
jgi:uncharacterized protein (DUF302 family)